MFWLAAGVGVGAVAVWRAKRVVRRLAPARLVDDFAGFGEAVRDFADEVREGMAERETQLREALGLVDPDQADPAAADGPRDSGERAGDVLGTGVTDFGARPRRW